MERVKLIPGNPGEAMKYEVDGILYTRDGLRERDERLEEIRRLEIEKARKEALEIEHTEQQLLLQLEYALSKYNSFLNHKYNEIFFSKQSLVLMSEDKANLIRTLDKYYDEEE